jgi:hypothetical protein
MKTDKSFLPNANVKNNDCTDDAAFNVVFDSKTQSHCNNKNLFLYVSLPLRLRDSPQEGSYSMHPRELNSKTFAGKLKRVARYAREPMMTVRGSSVIPSIDRTAVGEVHMNFGNNIFCRVNHLPE